MELLASESGLVPNAFVADMVKVYVELELNPDTVRLVAVAATALVATSRLDE